ncbi:MAG: alpha-ketoglutarate-dependent dioxygenase AlkB [Xanthobacteraceae bacterium]
MSSQLSLFAKAEALPQGFRYEPGLISVEEEAAIVAGLTHLPFKEFEFHGFLGKRRIVSFGWKYDFSARRVQPSEEIPDFLKPLRAQAGRFSGIAPSELQHVLVTEYRPGAAIGWHKDKAEFGEVIGISLTASCTFRFRRREGDGWRRASLILEPRSAYLLSAAARSEWEHSIPAVEHLRYSITFRTLKPTQRS